MYFIYNNSIIKQIIYKLIQFIDRIEYIKQTKFNSKMQTNY
jgi:hypothetical protein